MKVEPAWLNRERHEEGPSKIDYAENAKAAGKWIYQKSTRWIYTPHEFAFDKKLIIPRNGRKPNYADFELVDPGEYKANRLRRITELIKEIEIMEIRMKQYYKLEPKK